jgi:hypothetical protein
MSKTTKPKSEPKPKPNGLTVDSLLNILRDMPGESEVFIHDGTYDQHIRYVNKEITTTDNSVCVILKF